VTGVDQRRAVAHRPDAATRLDVEHALSICLAMVAGDRTAYRAAARMWQALAPFVPALTHVESAVALEALEALAGPDAPSRLRRLRGRAACHGLAGLVSVLDEWLVRAEQRFGLPQRVP
jgi:hypothetical protein